MFGLRWGIVNVLVEQHPKKPFSKPLLASPRKGARERSEPRGDGRAGPQENENRHSADEVLPVFSRRAP